MLYSSPTRPPVVESTHEIGVALGYRLVVVVYQQSVGLLIRAGDLQVLFKPRYNLIGYKKNIKKASGVQAQSLKVRRLATHPRRVYKLLLLSANVN